MFYNDDKKTKFVQIRISDKDKLKLKLLADSENLKLTDFVLKSIDFYIKNGGPEVDKKRV